MADLRVSRGYFENQNAAIGARQAHGAERRADAANQAYTDSTNLSTVTRQGDALMENEARKAQAEALKRYYAQPEASRGPVGPAVAPQIAGVNPAGAMALTQRQETDDTAVFKDFINTATTNPQAALVLAKQRGVAIDPEMEQLIGNSYFTQQLKGAFDVASKQYPGRPDLMQKTIRQATAEIVGNMAAAKTAGRPLPGQPMGFDVGAMPTAPRPPAPGSAAVGKPRQFVDKEGNVWSITGSTAQPVQTPGGDQVQGFPSNVPRAPAAGRAVDPLKREQMLMKMAETKAQAENPEAFAVDFRKNLVDPPAASAAIAKARQELDAAFPGADAGAAPPAAPPPPPATGVGTSGSWGDAAPASPAPSSAPAPAAPGMPYQGDAPPPDQPGAIRGGDGLWYVQQGGQWFKVVQ